VQQLFINFKKAYNSFRREVLYNIAIVFGIPMKLVTLTKMFLIETCRRVRVGKHLSDTFHIKNCWKQRDVLSSLLFNCPLECAIRRVHDGLKLYGTHQTLVYADDVNRSVLDESLHTIKTDTEALLVASKQIGVDINAEKTMCSYL
jgi:hypothetical protein